jgi:dATP pyrophosphohydrolase
VTDKRRYKRPESVLIVVYTRDLECLLLERVAPSGFWQSVTGSLEWGENVADAAARELREETGLEPVGLVDAHVARRFPIAPSWRHRYAPEVTENVEHGWYLPVPTRVEVRLNPHEHARFAWFPLDDAIERASSWTNREALAALREQ